MPEHPQSKQVTAIIHDQSQQLVVQRLKGVLGPLDSLKTELLLQTSFCDGGDDARQFRAE